MAARDTSTQSDISKMADEKGKDGAFNRKPSVFRNHVAKGGQFPPEKDRYHLYVSYACPWAHRTLITRQLKGLEDIISVSVVSPHMGPNGWPFGSTDAFPGATEDHVTGAAHIRDIYLAIDPDYSARFTVPVLYDKKAKTIVNNESSEIIRIFNTEFNDLIPADKAKIDIYPEHLRAKIEEVNPWIYENINNGVYRAGFATSQEAYDKAVKSLFEHLDKVEAILAKNEYLTGSEFTEADLRLWTTIVRFDPVYVGHFKCNFRTIRGGYPAIHKWLRKLYWERPEFKDTTNFDHIKVHYYWSHIQINVTRIVPLGPVPAILPLDQ
jgi:putative glutathione S-transferase